MSARAKLVERIAKAVLYDLEDRRGVGNELEAVRHESPAIYREIKKAIGEAALAEVEKAGWAAIPGPVTEAEDGT
jgi:hypothetical protein